MPEQATFSSDGKTWLHTEKGTRQDDFMIYTIKPDAASVFVAWGPPYTPSAATAFVRAMSEKSPHARGHGTVSLTRGSQRPHAACAGG